MQFISQFLNSFWQTSAEMAPFLLFGFFCTALSALFIKPDFIERHLGQSRKFSVPKAALVGVPLPLCSCSVIPVAMSLRKQGASRGATTAFLISTPQTGLDSIFVTYSLLGPVFTILRPIAAFISGVAGGYLIDRLTAGQKDTRPIQASPGEAECQLCHKQHNRILDSLHYGFLRQPREIGMALLLGLAISALINVLLPENYLSQVVGTGLKPMLLMLLLSIPLYVCATASVPIGAALLLKGVTPGAVFVFLMAGPGTNAAAISSIWKVMGKKTAIFYVLSLALCALFFGSLLDYVSGFFGFSPQYWQHLHTGIPPWVEHGAAVILFVLVALSRFPFLDHHDKTQSA